MGFLEEGPDNYVDWRGRRFVRDPTGRHLYRRVKQGVWDELVSDKRYGGSVTDPEGAQLAASLAVPTDWATPELQREAAIARNTLPAGSDQWEYRVIKATLAADLENALNKHGRIGWELVSMSATTGVFSWTGNKIFATLKRRVPTTPPPFHESE